MQRTITEPERFTISEPVDRLEVWLVAGRLNIVAAPGPCRVEVNATGPRRLHVEVKGSRLRVRHLAGPWWTGFLRWWGRSGYRCDITIGVPAQVFAELRLAEGNVAVSGLRHVTRVHVSSGRVSLLGLRGETTARLFSGDVEALRVDGDLRMRTMSGDLAVAESGARQVHARTMSGTITCDLDGSQRGELDLRTMSGDITVRVPVDSDLDVALRTTSGRITSGFAEVGGDENRRVSRHAAGRLGTGAGRLTAHTTSGNVALLAYEPGDVPE